jgi:hypothetical protein
MKQIYQRLDIVGSGRFEGCHVSELLADKEYCDWLMSNDWFHNDHQYSLLREMIITSREKKGVVIPFPVDRIRR